MKQRRSCYRHDVLSLTVSCSLSPQGERKEERMKERKPFSLSQSMNKKRSSHLDANDVTSTPVVSSSITAYSTGPYLDVEYTSLAYATLET